MIFNRSSSATALALAAAALFVSLTGCSLYRSTDREAFDNNAVAGAVDTEALSEAQLAAKECNSRLTNETVQKIFGRSDAHVEALIADDGTLSCRVAQANLPIGTNPGADVAICHFPKDAAILLAEGLDVLNRGTKWKVSSQQDSSTHEFAFAKRRAIDDTTVVCRFQFSSRQDLDNSLELLVSRGRDLTTALLER